MGGGNIMHVERRVLAHQTTSIVAKSRRASAPNRNARPAYRPRPEAVRTAHLAVQHGHVSACNKKAQNTRLRFQQARSWCRRQYQYRQSVHLNGNLQCLLRPYVYLSPVLLPAFSGKSRRHSSTNPATALGVFYSAAASAPGKHVKAPATKRKAGLLPTNCPAAASMRCHWRGLMDERAAARAIFTSTKTKRRAWRPHQFHRRQTQIARNNAIKFQPQQSTAQNSARRPAASGKPVLVFPCAGRRVMFFFFIFLVAHRATIKH